VIEAVEQTILTGQLPPLPSKNTSDGWSVTY